MGIEEGKLIGQVKGKHLWLLLVGPEMSSLHLLPSESHILEDIHELYIFEVSVSNILVILMFLNYVDFY